MRRILLASIGLFFLCSCKPRLESGSQLAGSYSPIANSSLHVSISKDLLNHYAAQNFSFDTTERQTEPGKLGAKGITVTVNAHSAATLQVTPVANTREAQLRAEIFLTTNSTVSGGGNATPGTVSTISGGGTTRVNGSKDVYFNGSKARSTRVQLNSTTIVPIRTSTRRVKSGKKAPMVGNAVDSQASSSIPAAIDKGIRSKMTTEVESNTGPIIQMINEQFVDNLQVPFLQTGKLPVPIQAMSTSNTIDFYTTSSGATPMPVELAQIFRNSDITIAVHEQFMGHYANGVFNGKTFNEEQLEERLPFFNSPDGIAPPKDPSKMLTIKFGTEFPVRFTFENNTMRISLQTEEIKAGDKIAHPKWVQFTYSLEPNRDGGAVFKRQHEAEEYIKGGVPEEIVERLMAVFPKTWRQQRVASSLPGDLMDDWLIVREVKAIGHWIVIGYKIEKKFTIDEQVEPRQGDAFVYGNVGDSISVGFNTVAPMANWNFSWATGRAGISVNSHLDRLRRIKDKPVQYINTAFTGAMAEDAPAQAKRLARVAPDYATMLMGANDICSWTSDLVRKGALQSYEKNMRQAVDTLVKSNPSIKITLSALPPIEKLYPLVSSSSTCRLKLSMLCPTASKTGELGQYVRLVNQSLEKISADYSQNVKFASKVGSVQAQSNFVSPIDCFHLTDKGEASLAELTWQQGWFAGESSTKR